MKITREENKTIYKCLICGHVYVEYDDGSSDGEKFIEEEKEIITYTPVIEETMFGKHERAKQIRHKAYVCPICKKRQIEIK